MYIPVHTSLCFLFAHILTETAGVIRLPVTKVLLLGVFVCVVPEKQEESQETAPSGVRRETRGFLGQMMY